MIEQLEKQHKEHKVFGQLIEYADFYKSLSELVTKLGNTRHKVNLES